MKASLAALLLACAPARAADVRAPKTVSLPAAPLTAGVVALEAVRLSALAPRPAAEALSAGPAPLAPLPSASAPLSAPSAAEPGAAPKAASPVDKPVHVDEVIHNGGEPAAAAISGTDAARWAGLSRRFDGAPLLSTTERVPGGRTQRDAYRDEDGGTVWLSRSLTKGHYQAQEHALPRAPRVSDAPRAAVSAKLEDGVLRVRVDGESARALDAGRELDRALATFGRGVRAVEGGWSAADLAAFNAAVGAGVPAERAALEATAVGRWAAAAGFTRALLPPAARSRSPLFVRPENVVVGRDGAAWRRTWARSGNGVSLERYESGERALWLERRDDGRELLVYEFQGESLPSPGTPAHAMAVFSASAGVTKDYVSDARAWLLDPAAERAAFERSRRAR